MKYVPHFLMQPRVPRFCSQRTKPGPLLIDKVSMAIKDQISKGLSVCGATNNSLITATASGIVQRLRRRAPSHFQSPYEVWHGVCCQICRQAGHGAAHSLATYLEALELIPRLAAANARIFFERPTAILRHTRARRQTDNGGYR